MQYTCWPIAKTFTSVNIGSTASGTHWANDREMKVALWWLYEPLSSPSFSLFAPESHPVCPSSGSHELGLHVWWTPSSSPALLFPQTPFLNPQEVGPHDPAPLWSQQDIPGVSALSLIISWLSLHLPLHQQSDRPPTHMCIQTCNIQIDTYRALMSEAREMKDLYGIVKSLGLFRKLGADTKCLWQHANMLTVPTWAQCIL